MKPVPKPAKGKWNKSPQKVFKVYYREYEEGKAELEEKKENHHFVIFLIFLSFSTEGCQLREEERA